MEKTDTEKDDAFCINVYSPGNFIAKTINIDKMYVGTHSEGNGFSDEQVAKALTACVGEKNVINSMK